MHNTNKKMTYLKGAKNSSKEKKKLTKSKKNSMN